MGDVRLADIARAFDVEPRVLLEILAEVGIPTGDRPMTIDTHEAVRVEQVLVGRGYVPRRDDSDGGLNELAHFMRSSASGVTPPEVRRLADAWGIDLRKTRGRWPRSGRSTEAS